MRSLIIRWAAMLEVTRRCYEFFHFHYMIYIPLLFTWLYIWKTVKGCTLQRKTVDRPPSITQTNVFKMCQNTASLRNAKLLYLKPTVKDISTAETRTANSRLSTSIFNRRTRTSLHSASQPRQVLLFAFTVNIRGPTPANCLCCILRHV